MGKLGEKRRDLGRATRNPLRMAGANGPVAGSFRIAIIALGVCGSVIGFLAENKVRNVDDTETRIEGKIDAIAKTTTELQLYVAGAQVRGVEYRQEFEDIGRRMDALSARMNSVDAKRK